VIAELENIEVSSVKKQWKKKIPLTTTIQPATPAKSIKEDNKTSEAGKVINDFSKWIMPSQLQAYIKCPRYDFL
jgi:hypothetical protein